jgi:hypothetical protein
MTRLLLPLLAVAATLVVAPGAGAATATLWTCHGPAGQSLGAGGATADAAGDGTTAATACDISIGALTATLGRTDPAGASHAGWRVDVPTDTTLTSVGVTRATQGLGGATVADSPQTYALSTSDGTLEHAALDDDPPVALSGTATFPATGTWVRLGVGCDLSADVSCAGGADGVVGVAASALALTVDDGAAPHGAVGGLRSPAAGTLPLTLRATDAGLGLASAAVTVDGRPAAAADLRTSTCTELSPGDAGVDLRLDAACATSVADVALPVDTTAFADGPHHVRVTVTDAAGNAATVVDDDVTVRNHPKPSTSTVTLPIGGGTGKPGTPNGGGGSGNPGVTGWTTCAKPRLSMMLTDRPLRVSHGVIVLRHGHRYRFDGRLTCLVGHQRRSAPKGTAVSLFNRIGSRQVRKTGLSTRDKGRLSVLLSFMSTRTAIFTYRSVDKTRTTVSIRIKVVRR